MRPKTIHFHSVQPLQAKMLDSHELEFEAQILNFHHSLLNNFILLISISEIFQVSA